MFGAELQTACRLKNKITFTPSIGTNDVQRDQTVLVKVTRALWVNESLSVVAVVVRLRQLCGSDTTFCSKQQPRSPSATKVPRDTHTLQNKTMTLQRSGVKQPSIHCAGETCSHLNHAKETAFKGISI